MSKQKIERGNVTIRREGTQIILPPDLSYDSAIEWLKRQRDSEEEAVSIFHPFPDASPLDALCAFTRALKSKYGFTSASGGMGFFGPRPCPTISVPIGLGQHEAVPAGEFQIPGIDGIIRPRIETDPPGFAIVGTVRRKHEAEIQELADLTRAELRERSIYRGKAIRLSLRWKEDGEFDPVRNAPQFLDLSAPSAAVFSSPVQYALEDAVWVPIRQTARCRAMGTPVRRGVLLSGPYGCGKTLAMLGTAKIAVASGWTFILLDDARYLADALQIAAQYAPAVLACEDCDRALAGDRDASMDAILNTLDGCDTKGKDIITLLTTNHVDSITQAALRPGRIDAYVEIGPPDCHACEELIRMYAGELLPPTEDVGNAAREMATAELIPAMVREVVERSKLSMLRRSAAMLCEDDLLRTMDSMEAHFRLMQPKAADDRSPVEKAAGILMSGLTTLQRKVVPGAVERLAIGTDNHKRE